jgi:hypothetical protein
LGVSRHSNRRLIRIDALGEESPASSTKPKSQKAKGYVR